MTTFVIADLHLGHHKAATFRGFESTPQHDDAVCAAWCRTVGPQDRVFVLGDCAFTKDGLGRLSTLPGGKVIVVMGNHDSYHQLLSTRRFQSFAGLREVVVEGAPIGIARGTQRLLGLSHAPLHPMEKARYSGNVHGHLHAERIDDPWYRCVSVEQCPGLAPIDIETLFRV